MLEMKKILVVDDDPKIVDVIKSYLEREGCNVFEAFDGRHALEVFDRINPDLIVLDLMLPGICGEDICKTVRKKSRVPIIMLTAKVDESSKISGLYMGADDYVTKPFSPKELIARIVALLRRMGDEAQLQLDTISLNEGELLVDVLKHEVKKNGDIINLTITEFNVLMTLLKYPQKTFTREELMNLVLGEDNFGYERVIDTHIKNLRQKIETNSKEPRYIVTVRGIGYRLGGE